MSDISPELMLAIYGQAEDNCSDTGVLLKISKNRIRIIEWIRSLPKPQRDDVAYLLEKDVLSLNLDDDKIEMWVCLNDVFGPAADGEGVSLEEVEKIRNLYLDYGWDGVVAWFSHKTGNTPWTSGQRTSEWRDALKSLEKEPVS
jgi:hypothetical protein